MKVWIFWGINSREDRTLLAIFRHHPTISETDFVAKRSSYFDYILSEYETIA